MKNYVLLGILLGAIACVTQSKLGKEYSDNNSESTFLFSADSTFTYRQSFEHSKEYSKGKFQSKGSRIVLNSDIQDRISVVSVRESKNDKEILSIILSGHLSQAEYKCEIFINDTLYGLSSRKKLISTGLAHSQAEKEINPSDLYFRYYNGEGLNDLECPVKINSVMLKIVRNTSSNSTSIFPYAIYTNKYFTKENGLKRIEMKAPINDSLFSYKVFANESVKVCADAISLHSSTNNKWVQLIKKM